MNCWDSGKAGCKASFVVVVHIFVYKCPSPNLLFALINFRNTFSGFWMKWFENKLK